MLYVRVFNTKLKLSSSVPQIFHNAYGIQKWMVSHNICLFRGSAYKVDRHKYKALLKTFCKEMEPEFDFNRTTMKSMERFVQNRFKQFCNYVLDLQSKNKLPE